MIDTHCHLDLLAEHLSLDTALEDANASGVSKIIVPAVNSRNWHKVSELAGQYEQVYFALGIHPCFIESGSISINALQSELHQQRNNKKWVAVGECGLDFYHNRDDEVQQKKLLIDQIHLANDYGKPVLLHCRKAHQDLIKILKQHRPLYGGIIHGFSGSYQQALDYINLGMHIGVGGVISYQRAKKTRATIAKVPLDSIVIETDSPDMPLSGYQGQVNQPKRTKLVLNHLIELRSEGEQTVTSTVERSTSGLFSFC
ncbi:TatD family hydrolase [Vibrio hippocampi]|uniref:Metal-dependent hydrolase YjjV n=1 Tax=Vibrio hippocampi TaxID=654686 RepID=A0ABM8ZES2_9VIBR|nr:TatD family hydrolase [Vibrio hippocampi]CAH0525017.1 putative metal-dependent hydrolase YjjV [Vibrio hippocampi]